MMTFKRKSYSFWLILLFSLSLLACQNDETNSSAEEMSTPEANQPSATITEQPVVLPSVTPTPASAVDMEAKTVFEEAEHNMTLLNTYAFAQTFTAHYADFPSSDIQPLVCWAQPVIDRTYCLEGVIRIENQFYTYDDMAKRWDEPVESTRDDLETTIAWFEQRVAYGLITFADDANPKIRLFDVTSNHQLVDTVEINGRSLYQITFDVGEPYHERLNYLAGSSATILGEMRNVAETKTGSGSGTVWISTEDILIRKVIIESKMDLDGQEGVTYLELEFTGLNEETDLPDGVFILP